ncbi:hypothetical protein PIB30_067957 [Stylosanthes scabra]|uniref:Uncharacterized protein n=1 Tax=Stylosanthes scabra TaxID=79078 RepID=A0ABU6ZLE6_9FABA|nr:hypothetical protein [Stylosanthes scabra]
MQYGLARSRVGKETTIGGIGSNKSSFIIQDSDSCPESSGQDEKDLYKVKDIFPYGTVELEHESGSTTFKFNGHWVKLYHEQNIGKEAEVYLLKDASDHRGAIDDHLVQDNSKWK